MRGRELEGEIQRGLRQMHRAVGRHEGMRAEPKPDGGRDQGGNWEKLVDCAISKSAGEGERQNMTIALHKKTAVGGT